MSEFLEACRPILFESTDSEYAYWGRGLALLVSDSQHCYCVTAEHVLRNQGATVEELRVFPSDFSKMSLPYDQKVSINQDLGNPAAYKDIVMLRVAMSDFHASGDAPLVSQDIKRGCQPATSLRLGNELWIAGFPSNSRFVDYEASRINATRILRKASYVGPSSLSEHVHELEVDERSGLDDFDGLSGGPVYYLREEHVNHVPHLIVLLAGLVIRGTASSRRAHFIDSSVLKEFVRLAQAA